MVIYSRRPTALAEVPTESVFNEWRLDDQQAAKELENVIRRLWVRSGPGVEGQRAPFPMARSGQRARFGVLSMAAKKRGILAERFFQARKMLSRCTEAAPRSRVKGRLRPYAAWCSVPSTRRRGDMLGRGSKCGSFALTAMQTGHSCRQLYAVFHRQQQM